MMCLALGRGRNDSEEWIYVGYNGGYNVNEYTYLLQGVVGNNERPSKRKPFLFEIFPNPTKGKTTIFYSLQEDSYVSIKVYNILGQKFITLFNDYRRKGNYKHDLKINDLISGLFIICFKANSITENKILWHLK